MSVNDLLNQRSNATLWRLKREPPPAEEHCQKTNPPARAGAKTQYNHYVSDLGLRQCPMTRLGEERLIGAVNSILLRLDPGAPLLVGSLEGDMMRV